MRIPTDPKFREAMRYRKVLIVVMCPIFWIAASEILCELLMSMGMGSQAGDERSTSNCSLLIISFAFGEVFGLIAFFCLSFLSPRFDCPHCGHSLSSGEQWRCGRCGFANTPLGIWYASITTRCWKCSNRPHTLQCPHCKEDIDLLTFPDRRHPAIFWNVKSLKDPAEVVQVTRVIDRK